MSKTLFITSAVRLAAQGGATPLGSLRAPNGIVHHVIPIGYCGIVHYVIPIGYTNRLRTLLAQRSPAPKSFWTSNGNSLGHSGPAGAGRPIVVLGIAFGAKTPFHRPGSACGRHSLTYGLRWLRKFNQSKQINQSKIGIHFIRSWDELVVMQATWALYE